MFSGKHVRLFLKDTSFKGIDAFEEYIQALQSYIHKTGGLTADSDTELE